MTVENHQPVRPDGIKSNITYVRERYEVTPIPVRPRDVSSIDELYARGRDAAWGIIKPQADEITEVIREFVVPGMQADAQLIPAATIMNDPELLNTKIRTRQFDDLDMLKTSSPDVWSVLGKISSAHQRMEYALLSYWVGGMTDEEVNALGISRSEFVQPTESSRTA